MKLLIKEQLELHHKSMHDIMYETGISVSTISRIACGKQNPSVDVLERIANAIGIQVYDLFEHQYLEIKCPHCGKEFRLCINKEC